MCTTPLVPFNPFLVTEWKNRLEPWSVLPEALVAQGIGPHSNPNTVLPLCTCDLVDISAKYAKLPQVPKVNLDPVLIENLRS